MHVSIRRYSFPSSRRFSMCSDFLRFLAVSFVLCSSVIAVSQDQGIPPFSTMEIHPHEFINLSNLNVIVSVPVRTKGAGPLPLQYSLTANNTDFSALMGLNGMQVVMYPLKLVGGFPSRMLGATVTSAIDYRQKCPDGITWATWRDQYKITDATGAVHGLPYGFGIWTNTCYSPNTATGKTADGFALTVALGQSPIIHDPAGNRVAGESVTDSNGNSVNGAGSSGYTYTDALDQTFLTESLSQPHTSPDTYSYTDAAGTTRSFTVNYASQNITTTFNCNAVANIINQPNTLPSSVTFPDGSSLGFAYEPSGTNQVTGRLGTITLPTGGQIKYSYVDASAPGYQTCGWLTGITRATPDGKWSYSISAHPVLGTITTTTVIDPLGNKTVYSFNGNFQTQRILYDNAGHILETVVTCYNGNTANCATAASVFFNVSQLDVYTTILGASGTAHSQRIYNADAQITGDTEYNYDGSLLKSTTTVYAINGSGACSNIGQYIHNRPCSVTVSDSSGQIAQTNYTYDPNGNALTVSRWVGGTKYLTHTLGYTSQGALTSDLDPNGTSTTYTNFACNGLLPQTVSAGGLLETLTWDCNGGVKTSITDASGKTSFDFTSNGADPFYRQKGMIDQLGNETYYTYQPNASVQTPAMVETTLMFNGGSSVADEKLPGRAGTSAGRSSPPSSWLIHSGHCVVHL